MEGKGGHRPAKTPVEGMLFCFLAGQREKVQRNWSGQPENEKGMPEKQLEEETHRFYAETLPQSPSDF